MRLLDTHTGQFVEEDPKNTEYAILSHTWTHEGEQTYHALRKIQGRYPPKRSRQPLPSHPHERPPIPPSSFAEPLDGSSAVSSPSQPPSNPSVTSEPAANERTPLLHVPVSPDFMEQGVLPGNHHKISRFGQLQLFVVHLFQWVWGFLPFLFACGFPRRPAELVSSDDDPNPSPALSALASVQTGIHVPPNRLLRGLSPSEPFESCPEGEPSPEGKYMTLPPSLWDDPELSPKIREACAVARAHGFRFIWIDSCCIDRSNSSELSEAIKSMYSWYASAAVCYAHLADVPIEDDHRAQGSHFRDSRWFIRGWTLPELVAPRNVTFLSQDWQVIGSKCGLADLVEEITGISREAFLHLKPIDEFSVAQRLSWASQRETTLVEDEAYSLLGIFGVDMPILYGEGERAFRRLQEEIIHRVPDQSLFAWGDVYMDSDPGIILTTSAPAVKQQSVLCRKYDDSNYRSLLATSPNTIEDSARSISAASRDALRRLEISHPDAFECSPSPYGIRTQFQMIPLSHYFPPRSIRYDSEEMAHWQWYLAILACEHEDHPGSLLGRVCYIPSSDESGLEFLHPGYVYISPKTERGDGSPDLFPLSPDTIERCRSHIELKTIYI